MIETWKNVVGYGGLYEVSNLGRVRSLPKSGREGKILSPQMDRRGYRFVHLRINGQRKTGKVHRLVAQAFLPNPDNYPQVNHKNGNKSDNRVSNLEWCSREYNIWHERNVLGITGQVPQKVMCVETGEVFASRQEAAEKVGVSKQMLSFACCGRRQTAGGYHWKYV